MTYTPDRQIGASSTFLFDRVWFMSRSTVPSEPLDPVGQIVGYARVSTTDQNLDRQTDRLTAVGARRIFTDTITGSTRDRPGLDAALNYLRAGDTLTVVSMDRLARSLRDLHTLVDELTFSGVQVQFLQEGQTCEYERYMAWILDHSMACWSDGPGRHCSSYGQRCCL